MPMALASCFRASLRTLTLQQPPAWTASGSASWTVAGTVPRHAAWIMCTGGLRIACIGATTAVNVSSPVHMLACPHSRMPTQRSFCGSQCTPTLARLPPLLFCWRSQCIDPADRRRIERLEIFDEFEEWHLIQASMEGHGSWRPWNQWVQNHGKACIGCITAWLGTAWHALTLGAQATAWHGMTCTWLCMPPHG